jgi:hypothetical protein
MTETRLDEQRTIRQAGIALAGAACLALLLAGGPATADDADCQSEINALDAQLAVTPTGDASTGFAHAKDKTNLDKKLMTIDDKTDADKFCGALVKAMDWETKVMELSEPSGTNPGGKPRKVKLDPGAAAPLLSGIDAVITCLESLATCP